MKLSEIKVWKFNIFDLSIIAVIVIFAIILVTSKINITADNAIVAGNTNISTKFSYTIFIEGLSETSEKMLKVGDDVYDKVSGTHIGKISQLKITKAKGFLEKDNGEVILADVPGKIDVELIVETDGTIKNGEYLSNGLIRIMVGSLKEIKTKYLMCYGKFSSINTNNQ